MFRSPKTLIQLWKCDSLSPECDLCAELHLDVVYLVDAADHEVDVDVGGAVHGVHGGGPDPGVVDLIVEDAVQDVLLLQPLVGLLRPPGGHPLEGAPVQPQAQQQEDGGGGGGGHGGGHEVSVRRLRSVSGGQHLVMARLVVHCGRCQGSSAGHGKVEKLVATLPSSARHRRGQTPHG